jgi:hypothetical protein
MTISLGSISELSGVRARKKVEVKLNQLVLLAQGRGLAGLELYK